MKVRYFGVILLFFVSLSFLWGQSNPSYENPPDENRINQPILEDDLEMNTVEEEAIPYDDISPRNVSSSMNEKYTGEDFDYVERTSETTHRSINPLGFLNFGNYVILILLFVGGLGVIYVIYMLIRAFLTSTNTPLQKKNISLNPTNYKEDAQPEDINEADFYRLALQAEQSHDFRLAYRYLFLDILQQLNQAKLIHWTKNKTNQDYISEIKQEPLKNSYQEWVSIFNYVWYGYYPMDGLQFSEVKNNFQQLKKTIR